ncbi:MAG: AAA family ATPase [Candidatus Sericytochromatia bacterium]|nr:AAA family ATPase [Candidatus Tanganyikabacteria bacterium]
MSEEVVNPLRSRLASYLPRLLVRHCAAVSGKPAARVEAFRAAILLADVSGFTALAERLARKGSLGAEELTAVLNGYFGPLIDVIGRFGGDIAKFAGDALLVLWPDEDLDRALESAVACGRAMQAEIGRLRAGAEIALELKVIVGAGDFALAQPGGVLGRWEWVVMGAPFAALAEAAHRARPGDVALAAGCEEPVGLPAGRATHQARPAGVAPAAGCEDPADSAGGRVVAGDGEVAGGFAAVAGLGGLPAPGLLEGFLPGAVRDRVLAGQEAWLSELRQVSVVFVNLPDLHHDMPLAFAQELIEALQGALYRHEGSLNKLSVDEKGVSLVAVLGLPPLAHADDAARAVRAAVAMSEVLADRGVRGAIGVASGKAFCGEVGNASRREYTVMGDVVNLAARLMQTAGRNILCDAATREAARGLAFEELPPVALKGKADRVAVFRPTGEAVVPGRSARLLCGRGAEKAAIEARLQALWHGGAASVLVVEGEAGIGKSELARFARSRCDALGVRHLTGIADALEPTTPFFAWRDVLAAVVADLALDPGDPRASLLAAVLPGRFPEATPQEGASRAEQTIEFLVSLLRRWQAGQPLLVFLEDSHWLDSASWALAAALASRAENLLLVPLTRPVPEPLPPEYAALRARGAVLRLGALGTDAAADLVRHRLGGHVSPEAAEAVAARAGGHPYFCEELAAVLAETGETAALPATIQGALTSRIDRLPPAEQLALKVASVVGRTFSAEALRAAHPLAPPDAEVAAALVALEQADLASPRPDGDYAFKHAITQEVAYDLLLHSQRREVHARLAEWLEAQPIPSYPLLAHHYDRAGNEGRAIEFLALAGEQALATWAPKEACHFLSRALELGGKVGVTPSISSSMVVLGKAYYALGKPDLAIRLLEDAERLCRESGNHQDLLRALSAKMRALNQLGKKLHAIEVASQAISVARSLGDSPRQAGILAYLGMLYVATDLPNLSEFERIRLGMAYLQEAIDINRRSGDLVELYGMPIRLPQKARSCSLVA